ncbi:MAG: hypothetical protein WDA74_03315 [Spirochaetota bacterium]
MHLLIRVFLFFFMLCFVPGCKTAGPLTPVDSFIAVQRAIAANDIKLIGELVSKGTKEKVDYFRKTLSTLDKEQLITIAKFYNIDPAKLPGMDFHGALSLYFSPRSDLSLIKIFNEDISYVDIFGKKAVIRTQSGFEIDFVKEGPYWKLDLSEL